ncbi:MAG: transglutaminase-like domain-containing protein, partial [Candidatus Latescibacterota bacterium]
LKKGRNVIDFSCPEAKTEAEGWSIYLARADEFESGGGNPADVGKTSFKSVNGGEAWKESPFGPLGQDRCEYQIRICLERHVKTGLLESPVIDLWREKPDDPVVCMHTIQKLKLTFAAEAPPGTGVEFFCRKGVNPGPFSEGWEPWEPIGSGSAATLEISGRQFHRRFLQFRAVLSTTNPLVSPVVRSMKAEAEFREAFPVPRHKNIYVLSEDNPPIQYSSVNWKWEQWDRPEFAELRKRENLDRIIAGSRTQYEAQVKLLEYATKRWRWNEPNPEYPEWDALSVLDRINQAGGGGMCIQFNLLLAGACQAYGWQARLVGIDGHEVCEIWSDDYGKWIYFDAYNWNHVLCDSRTGQPLSMLEVHNAYLDYFYPDRPMDWLNDYRFHDDAVTKRADKPPVVRSSSTYNDRASGDYGGFMQSRILRIVPRNNWYEQPYPRPLSHGTDSSWPWDGYVTWYDTRTPPRIQYSWYTDRPRDMWPELNRTHITATQGYGNDQLYLQFETYTPNFSHYEVCTDDGPWEEAASSFVWMLAPGKNTVRVRAASKLGVKGKPSSLSVNHVLMPFKEWEMK